MIKRNTMTVTTDMQSPLRQQPEAMSTAVNSSENAENTAEFGELPLPMAVCGQLQWVKRDFSALSELTPVNANGEAEPRSLWWPSLLFNDYDEFQDFFPEVFDKDIQEDEELSEVKQMIFARVFKNMAQRRSIMIGRLLGRPVKEYVEIIEFDEGVSIDSIDVEDHQATQFVSFTRLPQEIHHKQTRPETFMGTSNGKTMIDEKLYMSYMLALDLAKTKRMGGPLVPNDSLETDFQDIGYVELEKFYTAAKAPTNETAEKSEPEEKQTAEDDDSDSDSDDEDATNNQSENATDVGKAVGAEEVATEATAEESDSSKEIARSEARAESKDGNDNTTEQANDVEPTVAETPATVPISPMRPRRGRQAKANLIPDSPKRPVKRGRRPTVKVDDTPKSPPKPKGRGRKKKSAATPAVTTTASLKTPTAPKKRKMVTPTPSRSTRARRGAASEESPFTYRSKYQKEFYQFSTLIKRLQKIGWRYTKAKMNNWQYVRVGRKSESQKGEHLVDFFYSENEVVQYCMEKRYYERRVNLKLV